MTKKKKETKREKEDYANLPQVSSTTIQIQFYKGE